MSNNLVPLNDIRLMAESVAKSRLFGFKTTDEAMAIMLLCQAEGLHPAIAVRDYHVINGRPTLKADAMLARFQQAGGSVKWLKLTDTEVSGEFSHAQGGSAVITWTFEEAKNIGLTGKDNWKKYPRAMLRARVVSEGVRTVYPGAVVGVYTPEEAQDMEPRGTQTILPPAPEPDIPLPVGKYAIMLPKQEKPYTSFDTEELWVMEMNDMIGKIRDSEKLSTETKDKKMKDLEDANKDVIAALPEELRNGLML